MSRSYGRAEGSVDVKQTRDAGAPEQFVWRGRLYRVKHVLQQWDTSVTWWRTSPPLRMARICGRGGLRPQRAAVTLRGSMS